MELITFSMFVVIIAGLKSASPNCGEICVCGWNRFHVLEVTCDGNLLNAESAPFLPEFPIHTEILNIVNSDLSAFQNLSEEFQLPTLRSLTTVNLSNNSLHIINALIFRNVGTLERINLSKNKLAQIPSDALANLHTLQSLHLGSNLITEVKENAFQNLSNLIYLSLDDNKITAIHYKAFADLTILSDLGLQKNDLIFIPCVSTEENPLLLGLYLSDNAIIDPLASCISNLSRLYLHRNGIIELHSYSLANFAFLDVLILSDNRLRSIDRDLFGNTESQLRVLDLSINSLQRIPREFLSQLTQLETLYLQNNRLQVIESGTFEHTKLDHIDLSLNNIQVIQQGFLTGITTSLNSLIIKGNLLRTLPEGVPDLATRLKIFSPEDNPWVCDCNMLHVQSWLLHPTRHITIEFVCREPFTHQGKRLRYVELGGCWSTPIDMSSSLYSNTTTDIESSDPTNPEKQVAVLVVVITSSVLFSLLGITVLSYTVGYVLLKMCPSSGSIQPQDISSGRIL